jgi:hypothetical protein
VSRIPKTLKSAHDICMNKHRTHNHLLHLILHAHPAHHLHILHPAQDLMLHLEAGFHAESGALLDGEGVLVEILKGARLGEVDDDIGAAVDFQSEG